MIGKWKRTALLILGSLAVVSGLLSGCGAGAAAQPKVLNIALVPAENMQEQIKKYQKLFDFLGKKLNMEIKPYIASDYTGVIEAMRSGKVDVAWYGPFSYALASKETGAEAFILPVSAGKGKVYQSYFIARADTGIKTLQDLKGHTFTFGDPASTSGHLVPRFLLTKAGINPDKDLKSALFSGGHDATGLAVANGKVDAGAIWDAAYDRLVEKKLIDPTKVIIIEKSFPIPESPWAYSKSLPADLKQKLHDVMMAAPTEDPTVLEGTGYVKFVDVSDKDYDIIRDTAQALNLDLKKLK